MLALCRASFVEFWGEAAEKKLLNLSASKAVARTQSLCLQGSQSLNDSGFLYDKKPQTHLTPRRSHNRLTHARDGLLGSTLPRHQR